VIEKPALKYQHLTQRHQNDS